MKKLIERKAAHPMVSVTLNNFLRRVLGELVQAMQPVLMEPVFQASWKLSDARRVFEAPRSNKSLAAALMRGTAGSTVDFSQTAEIKFDRLAAEFWGFVAVRAADTQEQWMIERRAALAVVGALLLVAAKKKPGKRPRHSDMEVARLVREAKKLPTRTGKNAVRFVANKLRLQDAAVRRALKRDARIPSTSAAKVLLSE